MQQKVTVKENLLVSPFLVFFFVHSMQVGVGILGFEKYIVKFTGYDAWITIAAAGLSMHIVLWMIYKILKIGNDDIVGIHRNLFGKWVGGVFSCYLIVYFSTAVLVVLRTYVEVIQVWIFPQLPTWAFAGVMLVLAYYYTSGGFRIIGGICFLSVVYGLPLILIKYFPLEHAHFTNLLPMMNSSFSDLFAATKQLTLSYIGFELLLMYYPFIKTPEKSQKWAHFGILFTITLYLSTALVTFVYYNEQQLMHVPWATLNLWKIVNLPFIERFEYIGIAIWLFVVLPNICLGLWSASRGVKRVFSVRQRTALIVITFVIFLSTFLFENRISIKILNSALSKIGFYTIYTYIPLLFIIQTIILKVRKRKWQRN